MFISNLKFDINLFGQVVLFTITLYRKRNFIIILQRSRYLFFNFEWWFYNEAVCHQPYIWKNTGKSLIPWFLISMQYLIQAAEPRSFKLIKILELSSARQ